MAHVLNTGFCNYDVRGYGVVSSKSARGEILLGDLICNYVVCDSWVNYFILTIVIIIAIIIMRRLVIAATSPCNLENPLLVRLLLLILCSSCVSLFVFRRIGLCVQGLHCSVNAIVQRELLLLL